ncbi:MAG TPA: VWA domain-containing protein [Polyangiaceae bacterium]|jgi:Mg-chelatase subunit ChlD
MSRVEAGGVRTHAAVVVCALAAACGACDSAARTAAPAPADESETASTADHGGGTGARAKGEEGAMGKPAEPRRGGSFGVVAGPPQATASAANLEPMAAAPRLDPNARYATTYRPGGAALAAFDSAVARGQIPATYKDLVGDFGARYAPALERPSDGALAVSVTTERAAVGPGGGAMNLRVALVSSEQTAPRAPLSVHIVLDTSGSMSGPAIDDARQAAEAVVEKLAPTDDFSMVTFSDTAHLLIADGPLGPRRAQALERIHGVHADGGTNISSGLDLAYAQAHSAGIPADAVRIVMLLSDGHANGGDTDPQHLAQRASTAFQEGVETSAFGLGPDFDAALMSRIADRGAGGYYYLADSSQIGPALEREIDARLQPVATAVELRVRLRADVSATKVFGSRELSSAEAVAVRAQEVAIDQREKKRGITGDRDFDAVGGMRFFIPAFARADRHATMITLALPAGTGERSVASVEVRYKDRLLSKNVTREVPVKMRWAASDAESAATEDASVERMVLAFGAGETILDAADRVDRGDRSGARQELEERATVLSTASDVLKEPLLAADGARLVRLAGAVGGDGSLHDPLPLVVMLRGSGYGYL